MEHHETVVAICQKYIIRSFRFSGVRVKIFLYGNRWGPLHVMWIRVAKGVYIWYKNYIDSLIW